MGQGITRPVTRTDFEWSYTEEPHASRRKEIIKKYPQIKKLMVCDPKLKYTVIGMVLTQIIAAYFLRDASWTLIVIAGYCFGGVINHSMTLAIHEISHNIAFGHKYPLINRLFGMFGNLPLGIPYSVQFKKYHLEHHRYQGDDEMDVDIPTTLEAKLFVNAPLKLIWVILQPFFYAIRPLFLRPKPITWLEVTNFLLQLAFNVAIVYTMGWKSLGYLVLGTFLAMGLHPMAGHFISEHFMWKHGYETYSYYGPLNYIAFNVGYHNEHHDFPSVPGSLLPQVRAIAPEYYDDLPHHDSWTAVIWEFIWNPEISPYTRVKRRRIARPQDEDLGQQPCDITDLEMKLSAHGDAHSKEE